MRTGLLFSVPSVSVTKTLDPVTRELRRAGYRIVTYNTAAFAPAGDHRDQAAADFRAYPDSYDSSAFYNTATLGRRMSYFAFAELLLDTALGLGPFVREAIAAERPDFILHSHLAPWGQAVAACHGLPGVSLFSTFVMDRRLMLPFYRQQRDEGHAVKGDVLQFVRCQRKYRTLYAELSGACARPDVWDAYVNKEGLNIAFIPRAFQADADSFGPEYRFVGHPTRAMPGRAERRLLYLSLGTILTDDVTLLKVCLRVFDRLKHPAVVSLGKRVRPAELQPVPEHVTLAPFVDQEAVLGDAAIFITMGGMASVQEAIAAETPMLVIPEQPEQHITAKALTRLGVASSIDRANVTEQTVYDALSGMLRDIKTYRTYLGILKSTFPPHPAALAATCIDQYLAAHDRPAACASLALTDVAD